MLYYYLRFNFLLVALVIFLASCEPDTTTETPAKDTLFQVVDPADSGIDFANTLTYEESFNIYRYRNYYNGGGVALGDVNNDGLTDVYFSGNQVANRLYLNQGDLKFEDATEAAGVAGKAAWSTGVTMADINADGWLDIYLCNSGDIEGDNKRNELYLNNQDGTFREAAEEFGLANKGLSTHAVFFDYDRDGDLDCYLLNNSYQAIGSFNLERNERPKRDKEGGDILYRNDDGKYTDVSEAAGIYGSIIGFGLGITVGDVDRDNWPDLFISNDFFERDYLYMNNQDGTFREVLPEAMSSISAASMGADMADINNDGYGELFVTEMLPATNARLKTATTFENWNKYQLNLKNDYYHQFTRNMLQRNNGDGTFTEIGRLAGVEASDWSWGALIFDMENDGFKDLFVANGIYQDLTNRDFLDFIAADEFKKKVTASGKVDFKMLVDAIPSNPVPNRAFRNQGPEGDYLFEDVAEDYGLDLLGFSNGSAYGDLDNDGDLDLIVNNVNRPATVYRNHSEKKTNNHWLQIRPLGEGQNTFGVGTKATVYTNGKIQYLEHMPMRGFQSSMDYRMHFGLGNAELVDSLVIVSPEGKTSRQYAIAADQVIEVNTTSATDENQPLVVSNNKQGLFEQTYPAFLRLNRHEENKYSDFDRDPLVYHMLSAEGPALCTGDFNGDGRTDFYRGGARGQSGIVNLAAGPNFRQVGGDYFAKEKLSEDVACSCFDADGDGDLDLYVVSGSSEFNNSSPALLDRLYLNNGNGQKWTKSAQNLPSGSRVEVGSVAVPQDVDGDGDVDLFVGSRIRAGLYGTPADNYLLINDGSGKFKSSRIKEMGMVTDARWADVTGDGDKELLVVGEFMEPSAYRVEGDKLVPVELAFLGAAVVAERSGSTGAKKVIEQGDLAGWYNTLETADFNGDGLIDIVLGNHGLNSRFRASPEKPVILHVNDFDQNGKAEQILSTFEGDNAYPLPLLHDLVKQIPGLRKRYLKYSSFGDQTMEDVFSAEVLERSVQWEATEFRSLVLMNEGNGQFSVHYLPSAAQETPIYALQAADFDHDGDVDLLVGGNFFYAKPEIGRYDAGRGLVMLNDGKGNFKALSPAESGVNVSGEIREIVDLGKGRLLLGRNDMEPVLLER
jgi:hypothetical protein